MDGRAREGRCGRLAAFAIVAATGDINSRLWYPIIIAVMTLVIGTLFIRDTRHVEINA